MDPALGLVLTTYSLTLLHIIRRNKLLQEYLVFKRSRRKRKAVFVVVFSAGFKYRNIGDRVVRCFPVWRMHKIVQKLN